MTVRWDSPPHVCAKCAKPCWLNVCLRCSRELRRREVSARAVPSVGLSTARGEGERYSADALPLAIAVVDAGGSQGARIPAALTSEVRLVALAAAQPCLRALQERRLR